MSAHIQIEIDETTLRSIVLDYVQRMFRSDDITDKDIHIETKSKQNYKSEWESAAFRAKVDKHVST